VKQEKEPRNGTAAQKEPRKRLWRSRLWEWTDFGEKTLWDWLQLLSALAIPVVLAIAGFWFTAQQEERQRAIENQRAENEQRLEDQRSQDATLQAYLDQMSELMLEKDLRASEEDSEVRTLARARTLTVLGRLGPDRKRSVVQFLSESSLIQNANPVVDLGAADLSDANLYLINLSDANLSDANLEGANLSHTILEDANLSEARLSNAELRYANLEVADLSFASLGHADLSYADLSHADLSSANLYSTDLSTANLRGAYLSGAGLTNADLRYADLSDAQGVTESALKLSNARLKGAIMPNGQKYEDWLKRKGNGEDGENGGPS
jgi:uncharacterized protein YjbI with pentapeptide repeats